MHFGPKIPCCHLATVTKTVISRKEFLIGSWDVRLSLHSEVVE